jgi:hypothetical protein
MHVLPASWCALNPAPLVNNCNDGLIQTPTCIVSKGRLHLLDTTLARRLTLCFSLSTSDNAGAQSVLSGLEASCACGDGGTLCHG